MWSGNSFGRADQVFDRDRTSIVVVLDMSTDRRRRELEFAERALTLARERGQRGVELRIFHLLGEIGSHRDAPRVETVAGHYRQAMALANELDMRPLVAHCHLGLGKLHRGTGEWEQAREHFTTATTMYSEMDMHFWLMQAEAEMRALA